MSGVSKYCGRAVDAGGRKSKRFGALGTPRLKGLQKGQHQPPPEARAATEVSSARVRAASSALTATGEAVAKLAPRRRMKRAQRPRKNFEDNILDLVEGV